MRRPGTFHVVLTTLLCSFTATTVAGSLPAPTGEVLLRIFGKIETPNQGADALFDFRGLAALPASELETSTAWNEEPVRFEGVLLRDLLAAVGAQGQTLHASAVNDYAVAIPAADARAYDVLVAYRMNGAAMELRDKGPLWIVYPVDQNPELEGPETEAKMIWQLRELEVR